MLKSVLAVVDNGDIAAPFLRTVACFAESPKRPSRSRCSHSCTDDVPRSCTVRCIVRARGCSDGG